MAWNEILEEIYQDLGAVASSGVPQDNVVDLIDVGSDGFRDFFKKEILDEFVTRGGATCKFFEGPYGTGKTHLIRLLEKDCQKAGLASMHMDLSKTQSLEDWSALTKNILENITFTTGTHTAVGLPDVLDTIKRFSNVNLTYLENSVLPHPGFKKAMLMRLNPVGISSSGLEHLNSFLLGGKPRIKELKAGGVIGVKNPLSKSNSEYVLNTVISGLYEVGVPGTALFFDENERGLEFHRTNAPRRVKIAANHMRHLIDSCFNNHIKGMVATFTVLPGFIERAAAAYPALGHRLESDLFAQEISYRSPVIQISHLTEYMEPEDFLHEISEKLIRIVQQFDSNIDTEDLYEEMRAAGSDQLTKQAGPGYRRILIKILCRIAVETIRLNDDTH